MTDTRQFNFGIASPARGSGWGGPAKGAHTHSPGSVQPGEIRNPQGRFAMTAERQRERAEAKAKAKELKDHIYGLALTADREETQLAASIAWLNREEGMPVARNLNLNATVTSELGDDELIARRAELERAIRGSIAGDSAEEGAD
jgi:hypothetical protein